MQAHVVSARPAGSTNAHVAGARFRANRRGAHLDMLKIRLTTSLTSQWRPSTHAMPRPHELVRQLSTSVRCLRCRCSRCGRPGEVDGDANNDYDIIVINITARRWHVPTHRTCLTCMSTSFAHAGNDHRGRVQWKLRDITAPCSLFNLKPI